MVTMLALGAEFMLPYWAPEAHVVRLDLTADHRTLDALVREHAPQATFAYAMNTTDPAQIETMHFAAGLCGQLGLPTVWQTIEDPNSHDAFLPQARGFDLLCTSDRVLIDAYARRYPWAKVIWLPLAAQPLLHVADLGGAAQPIADLVLIANWYENEARLRGIRDVVQPLVDAGYSLALYSYEATHWPESIRRYWRARTGYCDVAIYYTSGRVALGLNNQNQGTTMTSMRTFEALACGKPFLASWSEAYEALGFRNEEHFCWSRSPEETLAYAGVMLDDPAWAAAMARRGRAFVLAEHTYRRRLEAILHALGKTA